MPESLLASLVFELREAAPWCSWMVAMAGVVYVWRCRGPAQVSTLAITLPLALACRYHGKPLYAAGSSFKFSTASQRGEAVVLKTRPDDAGIAPPELAGDPRLMVENLFFETIPGRFFEGIVTEYGLQPPFAVPALWAQTQNKLAEVTL